MQSTETRWAGFSPELGLQKSKRPADAPGKIRSWKGTEARTLRRELLDHVIVLNEEHLKHLLKEFIEGYYHRARPHQGLHGGTPVPSAKPEPAADGSRLVSIPVVGGLHHRYIRVGP